MTTLEIKEQQQEQSPSAMLTTPTTVTKTDSEGRVIVLRRVKPLQRLRFISAMGENSSNQLWVGTVGALMYVASIDGVAVNTPTTLREIEALYQRLDEHGMTAVYEGAAELQTPEVDTAEAKK